MNSIKAVVSHKAFENYFFEPFEFKYMNTNIQLEIKNNKVNMMFSAKKSADRIYEIFYKVYDLLFFDFGWIS